VWRLDENVVRLSWLPLLAVVLGCNGDKPAANVDIPEPAPVSDLTFKEPTPVPGGEELRLNPKAGAVISSSLVGDIEVWKVDGKPSIPETALGKSRMLMDYSVRVASSNSGDVTLAFESSPLKLEGKAQGEWHKLGGQKGEVRFDRRAGLLEDPSNLFEGLFGAGMVMFPESPIAPGSTWSSSNTRDMPPFGPVMIKEVFTYKGIENKNGLALHRIDSTATGSLEGMTIDATYYVREDGLPHSARINSKAASPVASTDDGTQVWAGFTVNVRIDPKKGER
jgi:hypothetical protein